ncbi:zinc finger, C2H2 type [Ostertagia ostertagi]
MDFAELVPMSVSSPLPVAISDPNGIQQLKADDSYVLADLHNCAETQDQNPANVFSYADVVLEGLDCEKPSTSWCKTDAHLDRLYENGVYEYRAFEEDEDIKKFYYMTEDSYEDVISQLEEEIQREENEAQEKATDAEKMIKEMEKSAKDFVHVRELMKKRDRHSKVASERREEKNRLIELKRELAMANKNTTLFCCFVCSKVFLDEEEMRKHISQKHLAVKKEYKYKCPLCYRVFSKQHYLRRHSETHKEAAVSCSICKQSFRETVSLKIHMSKVHDQSMDGKKIDKTHECKKCGQKFGIVEEVERHKYYCEAREKIAEKRRQARQEIDAMSSVSSMSGRSGSVISSSSGAASTVSIGSPYGRPVKDKSCPFCFLVCASMQARRKHIGRKHPEKLDDPRVNDHGYVKVVSAALPYACDICSKSFASHASLSTHKKRIHENVKRHECSTCGRSYPLPSELRKHIKRVHENELDYLASQKMPASEAP